MCHLKKVTWQHNLLITTPNRGQDMLLPVHRKTRQGLWLQHALGQETSLGSATGDLMTLQGVLSQCSSSILQIHMVYIFVYGCLLWVTLTKLNWKNLASWSPNVQNKDDLRLNKKLTWHRCISALHFLGTKWLHFGASLTWTCYRSWQGWLLKKS